MSIPVSTPRLIGAFCPHCKQRAGTIVLETGPVLLHHSRRYPQGHRGKCVRQFVAVPDRHARAVHMIEVRDRLEADDVLRRQSGLYLARLERDMQLRRGDAQAIEDVFGVKVTV